MSENFEKKSGSGAGLLAFPFLLALLFPVNCSSTSLNPNKNINYSESIYAHSMYDISNIDNNNSISVFMENYKLLAQRTIKNLVNCINNEPTLLGKEVSYLDYFLEIRNQVDYELVFYGITNSSPKYCFSILNLLSLIEYDNIFSFEKEFVISQLKTNITSAQEYAINTLSLWNDADLLKQVSGINVKNVLLQKRLKSIIKNTGV